MFKVERNGSTLELIAGPNGAILRTIGPGEKPKIIDLEGRFPVRFYNRLKEIVDGSNHYGAVMFLLPKQEEVPAMMVRPQQGIAERFIVLNWFLPGVGSDASTRFNLDMRVAEAKKLLQYLDEHMTC